MHLSHRAELWIMFCVFQAAGIPAHISWNICADRSSIFLGRSCAHDNQLDCHTNRINQWNQLWPANHDNSHGMYIPAHFIRTYFAGTVSNFLWDWICLSIMSQLLSLSNLQSPGTFIEYCGGSSLFQHNHPSHQVFTHLAERGCQLSLAVDSFGHPLMIADDIWSHPNYIRKL